jgi:ATP-binding cassette, subfamily F, member 3
MPHYESILSHIMSHGNVIIRFDTVTFSYVEGHPIVEEASCSVRENAKITIMGQNGAGKSTLFKLIMGELKPERGSVHISDNARIAIGKQVMADADKSRTVRDYFATAFTETKYNLDKRIADVLAIVNMQIPLEYSVGQLSGGQQARLLLAHALIQEPDILLLDEPTNNLDDDGIGHLTTFLMMYEKTVIVISHDANFLNAFTDGVLNVDVTTKKIEQYVGNYTDVVEQIAAQIEREQKKNAQLEKSIQDRKDKVNFFAHKGGKMRKLASKLRDEIEEAEENKVDVKRDDVTIRPFTIPAQEWSDEMVRIEKVGIIHAHERKEHGVDIRLRRRHKLHIVGPNGIGKSTLLRDLALHSAPGMRIAESLRVAYYQQDFAGLNMSETVYSSLASMMGAEPDKEVIYATAAQFLLRGSAVQTAVGALSEGQKGLLCYARFVLQKPGLLILDEPSNHINFRHLPVIAEAVNNFEGAVIIVSHMNEFMEHIRTTDTLDLGRFTKDA